MPTKKYVSPTRRYVRAASIGLLISAALLWGFMLFGCGISPAHSDVKSPTPLIEIERVRKVQFPEGVVYVYEAIFGRDTDTATSVERRKVIQAWLVLHSQKQCIVGN
jgi:hypothetical protein